MLGGYLSTGTGISKTVPLGEEEFPLMGFSLLLKQLSERTDKILTNSIFTMLYSSQRSCTSFITVDFHYHLGRWSGLRSLPHFMYLTSEVPTKVTCPRSSGRPWRGRPLKPRSSEIFCFSIPDQYPLWSRHWVVVVDFHVFFYLIP